MLLNFKLIGRRIKEVRNLCGISQMELAERAELSVSYISYIETAAKKASLTSLVRIANAMQVTVDTFLIGNQTNDTAEYQSDMIRLIEDCNSYEKQKRCLFYQVPQSPALKRVPAPCRCKHRRRLLTNHHRLYVHYPMLIREFHPFSKSKQMPNSGQYRALCLRNYPMRF